MAIDSSGSVPELVGLTVPPPQEEIPEVESVPVPEPTPSSEPAPLPAFQGSVVDESV